MVKVYQTLVTVVFGIIGFWTLWLLTGPRRDEDTDPHPQRKRNLLILETTMLLVSFVIGIAALVTRLEWLRPLDWALTLPLLLGITWLYYDWQAMVAPLVGTALVAMVLGSLPAWEFLRPGFRVGLGLFLLLVIFGVQLLVQFNEVQQSPGLFVYFVVVWALYTLTILLWRREPVQAATWDTIDLLAKPLVTILLVVGVFVPLDQPFVEY